MIKNLIKTIVITIALLFAGTTLLASRPTFAADGDVCTSNVADEIKKAAGCPTAGGTKDELPDLITNILNSIIFASGIVAVIFVVIGGINYITSTGDAGKIEKAKKTILYALIGLAVCALAFAIVNWAVNIINTSDQTPAG